MKAVSNGWNYSIVKQSLESCRSCLLNQSHSEGKGDDVRASAAAPCRVSSRGTFEVLKWLVLSTAQVVGKLCLKQRSHNRTSLEILSCTSSVACTEPLCLSALVTHTHTLCNVWFSTELWLRPTSLCLRSCSCRLMLSIQRDSEPGLTTPRNSAMATTGNLSYLTLFDTDTT